MKALKITLLATAFAFAANGAFAQSSSGNATMNPPAAKTAPTTDQGDPKAKQNTTDTKADVKAGVKSKSTTGSGAADPSLNKNLSGTSAGQGNADPAAKGNSGINPATKEQ